MRPLSPAEFLDELRIRGASRLERVSFRRNRSTIWSLTQSGTVLNVHEAYRRSPPELLDAFALIVEEGGVGSREAATAGQALSDWPCLHEAIEEARSRHASTSAATCADGSPTHCCATAQQRDYLRAVYGYFNATRLSRLLPADVPIRLSRRMTTSLGHMLPGEAAPDERYVVEIALNVDLMLAGNGAERVDTLLHEMAHAADFLTNGCRDHGPSWRAWAQRVGCAPDRLYDRPVRRRADRDSPVERVPPLPYALQSREA